MKKIIYGGFSLIEVVGVVCLGFLLLGGLVLASSKLRDRQLCQRVNADLVLIANAKSAWRVSNPVSVWPINEADRFLAIQSFLRVGYLLPDGMTNLEPVGIVYSVGDENDSIGDALGAVRIGTGESFDLATSHFVP